MRLFKPMYKNKRGKWQETKGFWIEAVDSREQSFRKVLRFSADTESEKLSKDIGKDIQDLIDYAALNKPNPELIRRFQDYTPKKLQGKLVALGLLPAPAKEEKAVPLLDYLPAFKQAIFEQSKRDKKKKTTTGDTSAKTVTARVRNIIKGCQLKTWCKDVTEQAVNDYIESRPDGMSQQTAHFYVQAFQRFAKWMFKQGHTNELLEVNTVGESKNYRRCFEIDEFERLLEATRKGPERYGLSGFQRYLLYLLAVESGLRRGELRSLTVGSVDFKNRCVTVKGGPGGFTKNQKDATQFITPETTELLREYTRGKMRNVPLFPPIPDESAPMIREDCEAAGVEPENGKGKIQFHGLRNTCGSYLAANGAFVNDIKDVMRHQDIRLTMDRYVRELDGASKQAINSKMPRFVLKEKTA